MDGRPRPRRIITAVIVVAIVGAAIWVVWPRIRNAISGPDAIHDAAVLPERIQVCGRSFRKDALERTHTAAFIREAYEVEPVVVDPGPFALCPAGACTDVAEWKACHTVIFVRVAQDGYMGYSLLGGP